MQPWPNIQFYSSEPFWHTHMKYAGRFQFLWRFRGRFQSNWTSSLIDSTMWENTRQNMHSSSKAIHSNPRLRK